MQKNEFGDDATNVLTEHFVIYVPSTRGDLKEEEEGVETRGVSCRV